MKPPWYQPKKSDNCVYPMTKMHDKSDIKITIQIPMFMISIYNGTFTGWYQLYQHDSTCINQLVINILVGGFNLPLWKMMDFVSWDVIPFPTEWKKNHPFMFQSPPTSHPFFIAPGIRTSRSLPSSATLRRSAWERGERWIFLLGVKYIVSLWWN